MVALDAPAASLRSENCRVKSAVEMTPRGKRGKLKTPKRVFHSFHRAWKSGKNKGAGFPHFHRAGSGSISLGRTKHETETNSSCLISVSSRTMRKPASFRSDRDRYYASEIPIKIRSESAQWRRFKTFGGDLA